MDENQQAFGDQSGFLTAIKNAVVAINTIGTQLGNLVLLYKGESLFRGAAAIANATLFTVQTGRQYIVKDIEIVNTSGSAQTYTLNFVPSGGTALASNALFSAVSIAANSTFQWKGEQVIVVGTTIQGFASAVTVTFMINGGRGSV